MEMKGTCKTPSFPSLPQGKDKLLISKEEFGRGTQSWGSLPSWMVRSAMGAIVDMHISNASKHFLIIKDISCCL